MDWFLYDNGLRLESVKKSLMKNFIFCNNVQNIIIISYFCFEEVLLGWFL